MKRYLSSFIIFLLLMPSVIFADTIYLKSSGEIKGIVERETNYAVTISVSIGTVTYSKQEIESISKSSDEENAKLKEKWKAKREQRETEDEQWRKFVAEQEAKGLIFHDGQWITREEFEKLTAPKIEEKKEVAEEELKEEKPIKLIDNIRFQDGIDRHSYSYAVRLPSEYNTKTQWPVLFCFDPNGNGEYAAQKFAYAADRLGWIIVGSFDAKNGPWESIISAQEAMMRDVPKRFSVDEKRLYAAGFSGGARMSFAIAYRHPTQFKGVIACGAGLPGQGEGLATNIAVYLCIGKRDPNFTEVEEVFGKLRLGSINTYKQEFEGGHEWPSSGIISQALNWIDKH